MKQLAANFCKVVSALNDGDFHDGDSLGETLQITRSAVWKIIQKLITYQVPIESVKGKGYRLAEPLILLNQNYIQKQIWQKTHTQITLHHFESVTSTSDFLKTASQTSECVVCVSELQTQGRGRFARAWYSPFASNLYCSCRYEFDMDVSQLAGLSLVVALATLKTLNEFGLQDNLQVKWPNDLLWQDKKIAGVLIDVLAEGHDRCAAIMGIGLNINMQHGKRTPIGRSWTSMREVLGTPIDRNLVCTSLLVNLIEYLARFQQHGFLAFQKEWQKYDALLAKKIILQKSNTKIAGVCAGVNAFGQLLIRDQQGMVTAYSAGEVTPSNFECK